MELKKTSWSATVCHNLGSVRHLQLMLTAALNKELRCQVLQVVQVVLQVVHWLLVGNVMQPILVGKLVTDWAVLQHVCWAWCAEIVCTCFDDADVTATHATC